MKNTIDSEKNTTENPSIEVVKDHKASEQTKRELGAFAIVSMNFKAEPNWYSDDPGTQWATRAPVARDVLTEELPDIIGAQEFGPTTEEGVFGSWDNHPYSLYKGEPAGNVWINSIAYNAARFTMHENLTRWLTPDGKFGKAWGGKDERGFSAVLLEDQVDEQWLWAYNVHLDHISARARLEGMKMMLRDVRERTDDLPVVMTGDLNTVRWPMPPPPHEGYYDAEVSIKARSDQEIFKLLEAEGFLDTNPTRHTDGEFPRPTFHGFLGDDIHKQPDRYVWDPDGIFVRNLATLAFTVITTNRDGVYPSDHYPIKAIVSGIT